MPDRAPPFLIPRFPPAFFERFSVHFQRKFLSIKRFPPNQITATLSL
jgi:hypothetical protein